MSGPGRRSAPRRGVGKGRAELVRKNPRENAGGSHRDRNEGDPFFVEVFTKTCELESFGKRGDACGDFNDVRAELESSGNEADAFGLFGKPFKVMMRQYELRASLRQRLAKRIDLDVHVVKADLGRVLEKPKAFALATFERSALLRRAACQNGGTVDILSKPREVRPVDPVDAQLDEVRAFAPTRRQAHELVGRAPTHGCDQFRAQNAHMPLAGS